MSRIPMIARKSLRYGTRRLRAGDTFDAARQDARVLTAVGLASEHKPGKPVPVRVPRKPAPAPRVQEPEAFVDPEVEALRDEYKTRTGRRPHYTWNAERIREAIASLDAQDDG